ncbi:CHAT domain-containing protein [Streptomyces sp. NPDC053367]|uniref:CHAT domain-containing protein n=1 Tax=Streptomyces sp. NPDC053367 TaxID=3365700 RepID=UPI0037D695C8
MEDLRRYTRTGDGRDLPPLPDAVLPPEPGTDPAETARLALIRWYRYRHLPGVRGLQEYRAAVELAGLVTELPPELPPLPSTLRAHLGRTRTAPRRPRFLRRSTPAAAPPEEERGTLGPARIDQLLFLMARFEEEDDFKALDTVIDLQIRWLREDGTSLREKAALLSDSARLRLRLAELDAHRSWTEAGERGAELAVQATVRHPERDDPHLANRLTLKARCAAHLHHERLDPGALERATADLRRAVEAARQGTPVHLHPARELVGVLRRRAEETGSAELLLEALQAADDLVRATSPEDRRVDEHRGWRELLEEQTVARTGARAARSVLNRPAPAHSPDDGARLAQAWRTADDPDATPAERRRAALLLVEAVPGGHEDRPAVLLLAAEAEFRHWKSGGDEASPWRARAWALQAVDAAPPGHRLAGRALVALAEATVHHAGSSAADAPFADEALSAARKARKELPDDDPDTPRNLERLSRVLIAVANVLSDGTLLPESLEMRREALARTPQDDPFRPFRMSNLAGALRDFAEHEADDAAGAEGLELARMAADALPEDHPRKHELLLNLAGHLIRGGQSDEDRLEHLAEAEQLYRRGLAALPPDHPDQGRFLSSISQVRHAAYQRTGDRKTLADAVRLAREAVERTLPDDPYWVERHILLARPCTALHKLTDPDSPEAEALRTEALRAWEAVAEDARTGPRYRREAQEKRAILAQGAGDPRLALRVLESLLDDDVPQLAQRSRPGPVRKGIAAVAPVLAARAARAAIDTGDADRAVHLLENGRAILYGQSLAARRYREAIERIDPEAAQRLAEIDVELTTADFYANVRSIETRTVDRDASGRVLKETSSRRDPRPGWAATTRRLAAEQQRILRRLSEHPEVAAVTRPASLPELRARIAGATVVFVLAHADRGDALLVPADPARHVEHVPLPGLTEAAVRERSTLLERALAQALDLTASFDTREAAQTQVHAVLEWLWDEVAGPVLDRVEREEPGERPGSTSGGSAGDLEPSERPGCKSGAPAGDRPADQVLPRLWWCPVGDLVRLPLHAAGHHRDTGGHTPRTVIDRVAPSYTPTLAALAHSLRDAPPGSRPETPRDPSPEVLRPTTPDTPPAHHKGVLVVTGAECPRLPPLPEAGKEAETVRAAVPGSRVLSGDGSRLEVLDAALREYALVHFACHGDNDSSLGILRGGGLHLDTSETLTASHIQDTALAHGAVAFLSACSTAEPHPELPDEPMHLAAAFQLAGFRSVIGTLWRAPDTPAISGAFYRALTADGTRPPDTTRTAQALTTAIRTLRARYLASPTRWAAYLHVGA